MGNRSTFAIVLLWMSMLSTAGHASPKLITSAVGRVRDTVVTSREVKISQCLEYALFGEDKKKLDLQEDVDSQAFAKQVTAVLLEMVVFMEAKSVAVAQLTGVETAQAEAKARARLSKLPAWKGLEASSREISMMVERKLLAKKFIRFRADSSVVPVSDSEAQKYFEQNRLKFGNLPYDNFKSSIKTFLSRQVVEKRLKDWFEVLQAKYQVRNFLAEI